MLIILENNIKVLNVLRFLRTNVEIEVQRLSNVRKHLHKTIIYI